MSFDRFIYSCNLYHSQAVEDYLTPVTCHSHSVFRSHCSACSSVSLHGIILHVLFCVGLVLLSASVEVIHTFARISSLFFLLLRDFTSTVEFINFNQLSCLSTFGLSPLFGYRDLFVYQCFSNISVR